MLLRDLLTIGFQPFCISLIHPRMVQVHSAGHERRHNRARN
jgi:hypothetical protein